jgi:hypothetical protein
VKQVVKVRVLPTDAESAALTATLFACNEASSWLSAKMHAQRVHRKYDAHKRFYTEIRERFGLSAQPAIRVISKVADAYTTLRANIRAGHYGPPGSVKRKKTATTPINFRVLVVAAPRTAGWSRGDGIDLDHTRPDQGDPAAWRAARSGVAPHSCDR